MTKPPQGLTPETYLTQMCEKLSGKRVGPIPHDSIQECVRATVDGKIYLFGQPDNHKPYVDVSVFDGEPLVKGTKSLAQLTLHLDSAVPHVEIVARNCEEPALEKILETITPTGSETFRVDKN